jgi:predicted DsbA family dithiol-disulfide isomerase
MHKKVKIDFVSDISCPWCAIGLQSLQTALESLEGEVEADIHFQPFELNPNMVLEGQDIEAHLHEKYGSTPEQSAAARENIRARGEALGFTFRMEKRARIYNTFDAHRLLHLAVGQPAVQLALKKALLNTYFTEGQDPSDHAVLKRVAQSVGMDMQAVIEVLESDKFVAEVRAQERWYQHQGINSVPAVILNDKHLISGGQPPEVFAQALRQVAAL